MCAPRVCFLAARFLAHAALRAQRFALAAEATKVRGKDGKLVGLVSNINPKLAEMKTSKSYDKRRGTTGTRERMSFVTNLGNMRSKPGIGPVVEKLKRGELF